jgi:hypothetical protein
MRRKTATNLRAAAGRADGDAKRLASHYVLNQDNDLTPGCRA